MAEVAYTLLGNLHEQDTDLCDEFEEAQEMCQFSSDEDECDELCE